MDISGDYRLNAPREKVWKALNDPDCLRRALPGCEELEKISDVEFQAKILSKIGPVKAKFNTKVSLANLEPPESYTLIGESKSGSGFAKGSADIFLEEDGDNTLLRYETKFQVGGKLAQIGNRLVGGAVRKSANEFFNNFAEIVNAPIEEAAVAGTVTEPGAADTTPAPARPAESAAPLATERADTAHAPATQTEQSRGIKPLVWITIAIVIVLLLWIAVM